VKSLAEKTLPFTGGCLCGKMRYAVHRQPRALGDCHCVDCRRSAGAPYVSWGTVDRKYFEVTKGRLKQVAFAGRIRSFAPCCGTQILFQESLKSSSVDFTLGSLDEPGMFAPRKAIWCEDHISWVPLDPKRTAFTRRTGSPTLGIAK
jgi:hypothetical protein